APRGAVAARSAAQASTLQLNRLERRSAALRPRGARPSKILLATVIRELAGKAQNWPTARRSWAPTLMLAQADEVAQASLGLAHRAATLFSDQLPEPCMPGLLVGDQLGGEAAIFDLADDLAYARASVVVEEGADVRMNAVLTGRRGVLLHHRIEA